MAAMTPAERKAKQHLFLEALGTCASIKQAARAAGVGRATIYRWQQSSATFRRAIEEANKDADDEIEDEIVRRGKEGILEPLVSMGKLVYEEIPVLDERGEPVLDERGEPKMRRGALVMIRKFSDTLLLARAKSRMKKYRDRVDLDLLEQLNEQTGGTLSISTKDLTADELAQLKQIGLSSKARKEEQR